MAKPQANFHSRTGFQVKTFGKVPHDRDNHWQKLFAIYIEHIQTSRCLKIIKYFSASFRTFQHLPVVPFAPRLRQHRPAPQRWHRAHGDPCDVGLAAGSAERAQRSPKAVKWSGWIGMKWLNRYEMVWYCADTVPYSTMLLSIYENKWL